MFVNYLRNRERESPVNVAAARVLLGTYLVWNVASYEWGELAGWHLSRGDTYTFLLPPAQHLVLPAEKWLLVAALIGFTVGYRVGATSIVGAVLLAHLATIMHMYSPVGRADAMFTSAHLLLFFGVYRETDLLTVDAVRSAGRRPTAETAERIKARTDQSFTAVVLVLSLLTVAILYFGSAVYKARLGPLSEWTTAWNLGRLSVLVQEELGYTVLGRALLDYPVALWSAAWGTVVLEAGLLVSVLLGLPITVVVLGLFGTHTIIALSLGPFFLDQFVFLLLFVAWDRLHARFALDRQLDVVFDEHCPFCVRGVYPFAMVDAEDNLRCYTQRDVPAAYRERGDVDLRTTMYVFADGRAYAGYYAFRELFRQYGPSRPVAWLMDRGPVERVGTEFHSRLARHRSRHFTDGKTNVERSDTSNG